MNAKDLHYHVRRCWTTVCHRWHRSTMAFFFPLAFLISAALPLAVLADPPKTEDEIEKIDDLFGDFTEADAVPKPASSVPPKVKPADEGKKENPKKPAKAKTEPAAAKAEPAVAEAEPAKAEAAADAPAADAPAGAKRRPRVVVKPRQQAAEAEAAADENAPDENADAAVAEVAVIAGGFVDPNAPVSDPLLIKMLQTEKAFVRRACKLNDQQEAKLAEFDLKWAKKKSIGLNRNVNGQMVPGMQMSNQGIRRLFERAISKELDGILDESQKESYQKELVARKNFDQEAQIESAISLLDSHLMLREEQVAALREALKKTFKSDTDPRMYFYNPQYLPQFPDASILKHLDAEQKDIYRALQKVNFGFSSEELGEVIEK